MRQALSPSEKLGRLLGMSLDQMAEILSWPVAELDRPSMWVRKMP
jgi:hypothetical protein